MPRKTSRRDFLQGKSVASTSADAVDKDKKRSTQGVPAPTHPNTQPRSGAYRIQIARTAMACEFEIFCNAGQYEQGTEAALEALDQVDRLEEQMSLFRPESELCRINQTAADEPVEVEPRLFALLERALDLYEMTEGAFDITASPLWRAWGFARREGEVPNDAEIEVAIQRVGSRYVQLDAESHTVRFLRPGIEINLGSLGKGFAIDHASKHLETHGVDDFLIHAGQSSVLARGTSFDRTDGWSIGLHHPLRQGVRLGEILLKDRALATSGSATQFFRYRGRRYGHILDPRTGWPAERVYSATVLTTSATEADALATAFYVMGPERTADYCMSRPEIAAFLICPAPRGPALQFHRFGLDQDELTFPTNP